MAAAIVRVSEHAIDRYIERIAPHLEDERDRVKEIILRLVRQSHIRPRRPDWVGEWPVDKPVEHLGCDQWACLVELGIAFPLRQGWVLTVMARASLSDSQREKRNARAARRRALRNTRTARQQALSR